MFLANQVQGATPLQ